MNPVSLFCMRISSFSSTFTEETVISSMYILGCFIKINWLYMYGLISGLSILFRIAKLLNAYFNYIYIYIKIAFQWLLNEGRFKMIVYHSFPKDWNNFFSWLCLLGLLWFVHQLLLVRTLSQFTFISKHDSI